MLSSSWIDGRSARAPARSRIIRAAAWSCTASPTESNTQRSSSRDRPGTRPVTISASSRARPPRSSHRRGLHDRGRRWPPPDRVKSTTTRLSRNRSGASSCLVGLSAPTPATNVPESTSASASTGCSTWYEDDIRTARRGTGACRPFTLETERRHPAAECVGSLVTRIAVSDPADRRHVEQRLQVIPGLQVASDHRDTARPASCEVSGGQSRRGRRPSCRDFGGIHERQHAAPLGIEHGDKSLDRGQAPGNTIAGKISVDLDHRHRARAQP